MLLIDDEGVARRQIKSQAKEKIGYFFFKHSISVARYE
jgi:hypothetical protein